MVNKQGLIVIKYFFNGIWTKKFLKFVIFFFVILARNCCIFLFYFIVYVTFSHKFQYFFIRIFGWSAFLLERPLTTKKKILINELLKVSCIEVEMQETYRKARCGNGFRSLSTVNFFLSYSVICRGSKITSF